MAAHSSTLAWKIPWTEELGRLQSMGSRRVGHDWATSLLLFTFMHWRRKWQPTPVFLPGKSHGRRNLVGYSPWGRKESATTRPSKTNIQKRCPLHHWRLECKIRKSRDTWRNRQIWPGSTKWSRAKDNRVLPREHTGHSKGPVPTTQYKMLHMGITRWSIPKSYWLYSL